MKLSMIIAVGLLSWIIVYSKQHTKKMSFEVVHKVYVMPVQHSSHQPSPCIQFKNHNNSYKCSVMTLDELITIDNNNTDSIIYKLLYIVFLPGTHFVNQTLNCLWPGKPSHNVTFIGKGNVTVVCKSMFSFQFVQIEYMAMSNIHFKNCSGQFRTTIEITSNTSSSIILFVEIQITGKNSTGIRVNFNKGEKLGRTKQSFNLINSIISTGNTGVHVLDSEHFKQRYYKVIYTVNITNTLLHRSCLVLNSTKKSKGKRYKYNVVNATFAGCTCSPVLSIGHHIKVKLNDVIVNGTQSEYVMHTSSSSLLMQGHCYFYNNKGTIVITSSSSMNISI